jgi:hypothetical protein
MEPTPANAAPPEEDTNEVIVCRVTRWYIKRRTWLALMLLGMGLYFLYDGLAGYPRSNEMAAQKQWFDNVVLKSFDEARARGNVDEWVVRAREKGWPTGTDGQPPRWAPWAAERGLPENPKHYTPSEIEQQYWFGGGCVLAAVIVVIGMLRARGKTLKAGSDHWVTTKGETVRFADVYRLDMRKWPDKGFAYAWYRENGSGAEKRTILDDLMYSNVQRLVDRLKRQCTGEIIEKAEEPEESEEGSNPDSES